MKYIHNFSLLLIVVGLLSSCDALDLYPEDYYGTEDFWQNSAQVEGYMIGLHSNLRDKYQTFYILEKHVAVLPNQERHLLAQVSMKVHRSKQIHFQNILPVYSIGMGYIQIF